MLIFPIKAIFLFLTKRQAGISSRILNFGSLQCAVVGSQCRVDGHRALLVGVDNLWRLPLPVGIASFDRLALVDQSSAVLPTLKSLSLRRRRGPVPGALGLFHLLVKGNIRDRLHAIDQGVVLAAVSRCPKGRPVVGLAKVKRCSIR